MRLNQLVTQSLVQFNSVGWCVCLCVRVAVLQNQSLWPCSELGLLNRTSVLHRDYM